MAKKTSTPKKPIKNKSTSYKIGQKLGHVAVEFIAGKNKLSEIAGGAIESVKSVFEKIPLIKKPAPKKAIKSVTKKSIKKSSGISSPAPKKVATVKKATPVKNTTKPVAAKKATSPEKATTAVKTKKVSPSKK